MQRLHQYFLPIWIEAPMLRILPALIAGIVLEWYMQLPLSYLMIAAVLFGVSSLCFAMVRVARYAVAFGICIQLLFFSMGALFVWLNYTQHQPFAITNKYTDSAVVIATLQEPLVEKNKSYKAEATVQVFVNNQLQNVKGNILVYVQKDSNGVKPSLGYGSQVVFKKPLQPIQNAGNPGGFDYQRYCAFHGLYYQVFLKGNEYDVTGEKVITPFRQMLFDLQQWVLQSFQKFIPGSREAGVAEALLIGYRNDLDADLVQSYSNTGVVHIIAISGMHLGLIYGLLVLLFRPLGKSKKVLIIRAVTIISLLWFFSLLTGAAPSIIRSAIMFTVLVLGETQKRKASIYNNLASSALLILLFDPFALWDVGFQLSYLAVLSIAIFATPISNLWYHKNKWVRKFWQLNAVTLAAQILTYPIVAYHFHQFPNLFLITNLVAVPLSSFILYGLLLLLAVSWIPLLAGAIGFLVKWCIWAMNSFIEQVGKLSFALIDGIYFTIPQAAVLLLFISATSWWLMRRSSRALVAAACLLTLFFTLRTLQFIQDEKQQKLIVYNVPQHAAIDVIKGTKYQFIGDSILLQEGFLQNFHLKPSRVFHQMEGVDHLPGVGFSNNAIQVGDKKIIMVRAGIEPSETEITSADLLIITGSPKLKLADLVQSVNPGMIVADATNSRYKISQWQKEAETLHLRFHAVAGQGAYTLQW
ncbi:MAG: ComEC/Rec2 family competence protein [Bacteroidota bacterium]